MISELTKEQKELIPEFVKRWTEIGLCTDRADRPRAENAARLMYAAADLEPPKQFLWYESPVGCCKAAAKMKKSSVKDCLQDSIYAQYDAHWLSFYEFFREVCGLTKETEKLQGLTELAKSAGWAIPYTEVCFLGERPTTININTANQLHCTDGPAVMYPDGWGIWSINGTRVPRLVVEEPHKITTKMVLNEDNAEVKRVMMERYAGAREARDGVAKFVLDAGAKTISRRDNYDLLDFKSDHISSGIMRFVKMLCPSTGACYLLRVPPDTQTVEDGMKYIKGGEYFGCIEQQT